MKVECAACQAKYQIPDERVAGRKLKIRCRKCGGAILVRGDQLQPAEEPTVAEAPPPSEWHVSIDGEQHGPYALEQMAEMLRGSQLAWDAHVWREGYADWKTAGDSDTLVRAVAAAHDTTATAVVNNGFEDDPTRMVQGSAPPVEALRPVARSAFAARAAKPQSQPPLTQAAAASYSQPPEPYAEEESYGEPPPDHAAVEGYGQPSYSYAQEQGVEFGTAGHPRVSPSRAMTGERHEDSVLFSARNLQARSPSAPSLQRPGMANGEGSGLIDIRALAALARTNQAPAEPLTNGASHTTGGYTNGHGNDEVLTHLANQAGAFARLDSIAPIDRPSQPSSNAVPIAIVAGSAMVAAAAFFAVYLTRAPASPTPAVAAAAVQPAAPPGIAAATDTSADEPEPAKPAEDEAEPEPERAEAKTADEGDAEESPRAAKAAARDDSRDDEAERADRADRSPRGAARRANKRAARESSEPVAEKAAPTKAKQTKSAAAAAPAKKEKESAKSESIDDLLLGEAKPAKAEPPPAAPKSDPATDDLLLADPKPAKSEPPKNRSIDELLDGAVDGKGGKPKAAAGNASAGAAAGLPESPTRDEVKAAMKGIEPEVKACAEGQTLDASTATVAVTVTGATGKVSAVRVTGIQGPVGSCIAKAVRGASFPKFAKPQFSINFPFRLK